MKRFFALAALAVSAALGDIAPVLDVSSAGITCDSLGAEIECTYRYSAQVQGPSMLRGVGQSAFAQYFTIYEFNGYVPGSASVGGLAGIFGVSPTTLTPSDIKETNINGPGPDITFVYTGLADIPGGTLFTGFSARSVFGPGTQPSRYSSVSTLAVNNGTSIDYRQAQSTSSVLVPLSGAFPEGPPTSAPEPMAMGLLGSGLGGLILFKRFRKN